MGAKQRDFERKKAQAIQLLKEKPHLSIKDLENLTGLSHASAQRIKKNSVLTEHKHTVPQGDMHESPDSSATSLNFQDSPEPVEKKSLVDQGLDSIKGILGIRDEKGERPSPPPMSGKLDPKRQAFVDNITPTISLAFMLMASWAWGRIGQEYSRLAPDEKVAARIVEPLVRIYARHANFLTDVNPDVADAGASLFALVGYVYASLGMYQQIREEQAAYEQNSTTPTRYREYRTNGHRPESGIDDQGSRQPDIQGTDQGDVGGNSGHGRAQVSVDRANLTPTQQRQYEALSALAEQDYQSRLRRSSQFRGVRSSLG